MSSQPENGIRAQKTRPVSLSPPRPFCLLRRTRSRFFPLVPSITKHPVCIEPTMNAGLYRFHNRRDKNSSSLVPRCPVPWYSFSLAPSSPSSPISFSPSFSSLLKAPSWPHGAGASDVWQNKRLSTGLVLSEPSFSLKNRLPRASPAPFSPFPGSVLLHMPRPKLPHVLARRSHLDEEEGLRTIVEGCLSWPALPPAWTSNEPSCTNYRKLVHFLRRLGIPPDVGITAIVSPYCPFVLETRFFIGGVLRAAPPGARSFFAGLAIFEI